MFNNNMDNSLISWGILGTNGYPLPYWGVAGDFGSYGMNAWAKNPPADSRIGVNMQSPASDYWRGFSQRRQSDPNPGFFVMQYMMVPHR